jgi:hypothetical protein
MQVIATIGVRWNAERLFGPNPVLSLSDRILTSPLLEQPHILKPVEDAGFHQHRSYKLYKAKTGFCSRRCWILTLKAHSCIRECYPSMKLSRWTWSGKISSADKSALRITDSSSGLRAHSRDMVESTGQKLTHSTATFGRTSVVTLDAMYQNIGEARTKV